MAQIQDLANTQEAILNTNQISFDNLENTTLNQKLESIFNNLIYNNTDIKLIPKNFEPKNLLILFDYFFNKLNEITTIPLVLEKRNDVFKYLSEILINNLEKIQEKKEQEKISKYFYNLNFFQIVLDSLKNSELSLFKEKFALFIKVSLIYFILLQA